jgi:hypothetical protein
MTGIDRIRGALYDFKVPFLASMFFSDDMYKENAPPATRNYIKYLIIIYKLETNLS